MTITGRSSGEVGIGCLVYSRSCKKMTQSETWKNIYWLAIIRSRHLIISLHKAHCKGKNYGLASTCNSAQADGIFL